MDFENYNWCLTLPEELADARDFKAEQTIDLDWSIKLPKTFSLWERVYSTNYQWSYWSCTSNATSHWVQVLNVKANWKKPETENIITPSWRDLWSKMGHDLNNVNDSWDYVEKAVSTAYKMKITNEEWGESIIDWYCHWQWSETDKGIETLKRYLYNWQPIVWCMRWNYKTWIELSNWELKTIIPASERTWGHAIALVGWDESWLRFLNSWKTNDWKGLKCRFHVDYTIMKKAAWTFNWRYWIPFLKEQAKQDPEYLKRKNIYIAVLTALKKTYPVESVEMQKAIEQFSQVCRKNYKEINEELPLNS